MAAEINHKQLFEKFLNASVRVEVIIHLGTMCNDYAFPDSAKDAFDEDWDGVWKALGLTDIPDGEDMDYEEITTWLYEHGKVGWLIQSATPVPTFTSDSNWHHHGWGYYTTKWVYAEAIEDAMNAAFSWPQVYRNEQRVKQGFGDKK